MRNQYGDSCLVHNVEGLKFMQIVGTTDIEKESGGISFLDTIGLTK